MSGARVSESVLRALALPPLSSDAFGYLESKGVDLKVFDRMEYVDGATRGSVATGFADYVKEYGVKGYTFTLNYGGVTFDVRC